MSAASPILCDAGPLMVLGKLNRLELLADLYREVQSIRGTLGVLVSAYRKGLIAYSSVELLVQEIAARPDIWISDKLCGQVLAALRSSVD